jgi:phosphatidylserine/phosphatidylglycerophosphate/cardiolipin synthase-like enzyme
LSAAERGNPATAIDRGGPGWSEGNHVEPLIHGATYFARLLGCFTALKSGDALYFTDWRGDPDELLGGPGTALGEALTGLARRGVAVRGLVWRSHPDEEGFSEEENEELGRVVNEAGGCVLLDERVRRGGCHHQKLALLLHRGRPEEDVAFVGGIDLCHGRHDDERHHGDPQAIKLDEDYGPHPAWHDAQVEIRGPAVALYAETFRERWEDPAPLDHRNPWRARVHRMVHEPRNPAPLPFAPEAASPAGGHAVQVLRTYPERKPPYPFAPRGERSVARAYRKVLERASSFVYLEDQYLWSAEAGELLAAALRRSPELRVIAVVPRHPDRTGTFSGPPSRIGQQAAVAKVRRAGGDRVVVFDLENEEGRPIYVHAKVCVVDDVWAAVGSDNINRRSWTHDSELSCAVIDDRRDERHPADPGGQGDGARAFARDLRLQLWREHLGSDVSEDVLLDPVRGFDAWVERANALDRWYRDGRPGPRPPGRVRPHRPPPVTRWSSWWAGPAYRYLVDPDGRPADLRKRNRY